MRFQDLQPYHEVLDEAKFTNLVESMTANGWQGSPLVAYEGYLLNGSHRWAAACEVAKDNYLFSPEIVELEDIFDLDGVEEDLEEEIMGLDNWQRYLTSAVCRVSPHTCQEYGLDIH